MNRRIAIATLLLSSSLLAQETPTVHPLVYQSDSTGQWTPPHKQRDWTLTFTNGVGYRSDRQKFTTTRDDTVSYLDHFNTVYTTLNLLFTWDRVLIKLCGDYGWLANGKLHLKDYDSALPLPANNFSTFKMASGYSANADASLGCRIKFWKFPCGSLSFIPALGFMYSHFNAMPDEQKSTRVPDGTGYTTLNYSHPIQQDWFGPYAEGRVAFSWKEAWRLDFYYQYIPVYFRETQQQSIDYFYLSADSLTQTGAIVESISSKANTTRTQLGGVDISYRSKHHWRLGAHFDGFSTWTDTGHQTIRANKEEFYPADTASHTKTKEKFSVNWVQYSTNFYWSYWY